MASIVLKAVTDGSIQLVFISPESRLHNLTFRNMLLSTVYKDNLVALAIDEAHCIKTWLDRLKLRFIEHYL